jgi:hypothetical protein
VEERGGGGGGLRMGREGPHGVKGVYASNGEGGGGHIGNGTSTGGGRGVVRNLERFGKGNLGAYIQWGVYSTWIVGGGGGGGG